MRPGPSTAGGSQLPLLITGARAPDEAEWQCADVLAVERGTAGSGELAALPAYLAARQRRRLQSRKEKSYAMP